MSEKGAENMLSAKSKTILKKRLPFSEKGLLFEEHETLSLYLHRKRQSGEPGDNDTESLFYLPAAFPLPEPGDRIVSEKREYTILETIECRGIDNELRAVKCRAVPVKKI